MTKVKLNFQPNKPTVNNRIYNEYILDKALRNLFSEKNDIHILTECVDIGQDIPPEKIAGFVRSYKIVGDIVILEVELSAKHKSIYSSLVSQNICFASIIALGGIDNDGITILDDLKIEYFFFTKEATQEVVASFTTSEKPNEDDLLKPKRI